MRRRALLVLLVLLPAGCRVDVPRAGTLDADLEDGAAPNDTPPADTPPGFVRLIGRTWTQQPGESFRCVRVTVPETIYITSISASSPDGMVHAMLSLAGPNDTAGPDGELDCGPQNMGNVMLYASGIGTRPLELPSGVGLRIAAGEQIHLNVHLHNPFDQALSGDSAVFVIAQTTALPDLAELAFAGKLLFSIPPGGAFMIDSNGCNQLTAQTVFATWPLMHGLGTSLVSTARGGGSETTLHSAPFSIDDQQYDLKVPQLRVEAGQRIDVTCRYNNDTPSSVESGFQFREEQCLLGLYRFPAVGTRWFDCALQ